MCMCICVCSSLSHVQLFAIPWTVAGQAPLSMDFSRKSSQPRNQTQISSIAGGFFTVWATRKPHLGLIPNANRKYNPCLQRCPILCSMKHLFSFSVCWIFSISNICRVRTRRGLWSLAQVGVGSKPSPLVLLYVLALPVIVFLKSVKINKVKGFWDQSPGSAVQGPFRIHEEAPMKGEGGSDPPVEFKYNTWSWVLPLPLWASLVAQLVKNLPAMQKTWVWSLGWEDPLEKGKATYSSILAWKIPWTV